MNKLKSIAGLILLFFSLPFYAGFFDDFDSNKFMDNVTDKILSSNPSINDMLFAKGISPEGMPESITKDFVPSDNKIYAFLKLDNFDSMHEIEAEWSFHLNDRWISLGSFAWTPAKGSPDAYFYMSSKNGRSWSVGEYKVEISIDKELIFARYFNVKDIESSGDVPSVKTAKSDSKAKSEILNEEAGVSDNSSQSLSPEQISEEPVKQSKTPVKQSSEEDFSL